MAVYDPEKEDVRSGSRERISADELRHRLGFSERDEANLDEDARAGYARDIVDREHQASRGRPATGSGSATDDEKPPAASPSSRESLRDREGESGSLFNPDDSSTDRRGGRMLMKLARGPKRLSIVALISLTVGGGSALGIFGLASEPLKLIQAGRLIPGIHISTKEEQFNGRMFFSMRHLYHFFYTREPYRSRLGYLSNKMADRAHNHLLKLGIESTYRQDFYGLFSELLLDPSKMEGKAFASMTEEERKDPHRAAAYLEKEFGLQGAVREDGRIAINADSLSRKLQIRFTNASMKSIGVNGAFADLFSKNLARRNGYFSLLHPIKKADYKTLKKAAETAGFRRASEILEKVRDKFFAQRQEKVSKGTSAVRPTIETDTTDEEGQPDPESDAEAGRQQEEINETVRDAEAARSDPTKMNALREKLNTRAGRTGLGILGLVDVMCLAWLIFGNIDKLNHERITLPLMRLAAELRAVGSQLESGIDLEGGNLNLIGLYARQFATKGNGADIPPSEFYDAKSINNEFGKDSGYAVSENIRTDPEDNLLARIFGPEVSDVVRPTCAVVNSTVGGLVLFGVAIVAGGPASAVLGAAIGALALPILIQFLSNRLAGTEINVRELVGAPLGDAINYGWRHIGNAMAMAMGALPLTDEESGQLQRLDREMQLAEFQHESLTHRLFSPTDPQSFMAQVIRTQSSDPTTNIAKFASGFLNIGHNLTSLVGRQLQVATVGAAVQKVPHDYGFPDFAYTQDEMDKMNAAVVGTAEAERWLPKQVEKRAVDMFESQDGEMYRKRLKVCFGAKFEKLPTIDRDNPTAPPLQLWTLLPPAEGDSPMYSTVQSGSLPASENDGTNYKCTEKNDDWLTLRWFLMDNMNAITAYCAIGKVTDPLTTESCKDVGMEGGNRGSPNMRPGARSGLAWSSGVHADNPVSEDEAWGAWRGRPIDIINVFTDRRSGWGGLINPFNLDQYVDFEAKGGMVDISQPLFPEGEGDYGSCANGAYNGRWAEFGSKLANNNMDNPKTIVRLGWEFNLGNALDNADTFKRCFVQSSTAIKSTAPNVLIDWTVAGNGGDANLFDNFYPGSDVVDIIGTDWYDAYHPAITSQETFDASCHSAAKLGPCFFADKARELGKKFSVGEWGATSCSGGTDTPDNDLYIEYMEKMFNTYKDVLAYEAYYDDTQQGNVCSSIWDKKGPRNPRASVKYVEKFGINSEHAVSSPPTEL